MYNNTSDNMVMPVAPYAGNGGGIFNGNDDMAYLLLFFLLCGNNGNGIFGGNGMNQLYPWMNQSNQMTDGFQNQMLNDNITGIQTGVNNIQTQLCNGFNGVNMGMANNTFALQNSINGLSSQFSDCCCENRLATADLKYTMATEAANTRAASTADSQAILDKLCQLELDGVKAESAAKDNTIAQLRSQLDVLNTNATVNNAVSRILADNAAQTAILNPAPIPAFTVPAPYNCNCNGSWS